MDISIDDLVNSFQLRHSISMGSLRSMDSSISVSPWRCPETCIVKVSMDTDDSHETNYYKSIMVSFSEL